MQQLMAVALAVTVSAGAFFCVPAAAVSASSDDGLDAGYIGFRLLEAPVVRRDDPRALKYIVDHLKPGTTIERRFEVANQSDTGREVKLYAAAAKIAKNRFVFADGRTPNALSEWTSVRPGVMVLEPWEKAEAKVTIRVPKEAAPGERYAVVWAQNETPPDARHNIGSIMRVGTRVYLDISDSGEYADFRITKLVARRDKEGRPSVVAHVHNTGKRALDLQGKLRLLDGPGGLDSPNRPVTQGTTLPPGGRGTVSVDGLDERLPAGPWTARLELESGTVKHTLSARLTFPAPGGTSLATIITASGPGFWYASAGVLATCGAGLSLMSYRRRRASTGQA
ncbi:peptidase [Streptomyces sp. NPDC101110]|uniref:peptidase n=1 Tax=Streptomyces sp. NPDC101110 TaxID=3366104 RepID=UPI00382AB32F